MPDRVRAPGTRPTGGKETGKCYLVGAGPGDLGLVTLKAKACVEEADVIVYDNLCNREILDWARPGAEVVYAGKKAGDHAIPQGGINALLVERALEGKTVTRLKGGDPMVFGRGGEEAQELAEAGVRFEIVPGVSSSIAGPAYAGIPVTHRAHNTQLTILTGHEDPTKPDSTLDFDHLAKTPGTKVFLMGVKRIAEITGELVEHGADPDTPAAMVRQATTPGQETLVATLGTLADRVKETGFKAPAVCVIGGVVGLRDRISWFENRPLAGKKVVVTRTRSQAGALTGGLRALGADAYEIPTIRTEPPQDLLAFARLVQDAHTYDWILFTSPNGATAFFDAFFKIYPDARSIGGARIAAIGPGTAKVVKAHHLAVDLMPEEAVAEAFVDALVNEAGSLDHLRILWVRPESARDVIATTLADSGAIVDQGIAYRTVAESGDPTGGQARFRDEGADLITFTSSSTVEHFLALGLPIPPGTKTASIGPITSQTLRDHGIAPDIEAGEHTIAGLVQAVVNVLGAESR